MRDGLTQWFRDLKRRHLKALLRHPHHYAVAAGLTLFSVAIGAWETSAVYGAWAYAVLENLATCD